MKEFCDLANFSTQEIRALLDSIGFFVVAVERRQGRNTRTLISLKRQRWHQPPTRKAKKTIHFDSAILKECVTKIFDAAKT